ncbi:SAM-dependent methyltransferase [Archangium minus]|uniref:S-adenosyl-L-methionine-dependent methyltransferase n=1 Tax=Archangium minus TaxID=83450 RepID=A0ABY9X3Q5_9BACT|nr:SAM-dependent methyltransferase [Archangium minus]
MANPAAQTAFGPMVIVAVEQLFPPGMRLIQDDVAYRFLPTGMRALVVMTRLSSIRAWFIRAMEKKGPGLWGLMPCRKRYIDDKVTEALSAGIETVVNLGAGLDTRAYRLAALANVPVFEVDQPENIEYKRTRLQALLGEVPAHVKLVPIDFERQELESALASHGHALGRRTFFIWEGVTQYLTEAGVRKTFEFLARSGRGSRLAFTYVRKDFIEGSALYGQEEIYQTMRVKNDVWRFGLMPEHIADFLKEYAWRELEQVGSEELSERYVKPSGRSVPVSAIERIVYAEKL